MKVGVVDVEIKVDPESLKDLENLLTELQEAVAKFREKQNDRV